MAENNISKFVILAYPRTRSTHLRLSLNKHPEICCEGELFNDNYLNEKRVGNWSAIADSQNVSVYSLDDLKIMRRDHPVEYMDYIYSILAKEKQVVGFKLFPEQNAEIFEQVLNNKCITKIVLLRNFLFSHLSIVKSLQTDEWLLKKGQKGSDLKVTFEREKFEEYFDKKIGYLQRIVNSLVESGQRFHLCFSEDINSDLCWEEIYNLLGVSSFVRIDSGITQQNPSYLEERVNNYQEMVRQLTGTKYSKFLYGDFIPDRQKFLDEFILAESNREAFLHKQNDLLTTVNDSLLRKLKEKESAIEKLKIKGSHSEENRSQEEESNKSVKERKNDATINKKLKRKISEIENSVSYRIGYGLTRIPAAVYSLFKPKVKQERN